MKDQAHDQQDATGAAASPDEGPAVRRSNGLCVRTAGLSSLREEAREVDFVCSTDTIDSYGEKVTQTWDLTRFESNPVALFAHDARALPIGQWLNMRLENGALTGTLRVASAAANPLAENVWRSIVEKTLRTVSVGFWPHKVSVEEIDGKETVVLDENELVECSVVPIPANPDALAKMVARAREEHARVRDAVPYEAAKPVDAGKWDSGKAHLAKHYHQFDMTAPWESDKSAPVGANKEPAMATENEPSTKKKDDGDEEMSGKVVCPECGKSFKPKGLDTATIVQRAVDAEGRATAAATDRDTKVKAALDARDVAEKALAETREKMLGMQVENDLLPLIGTKLAPAEKDGLVEFGKFCLAKGEVGAAQWRSHVDGIKSRGDIPQKTGGSLLPTEANSGAERNAEAASDELVAIVNSTAKALTA